MQRAAALFTGIVMLMVFGCGKDEPTGGDGDARDGGEIEITLPGDAVMEMVWIPAGTFVMGTAEDQEQWIRSKEMWERAFENEKPSHQVTITRGFYLGKVEITQEQWASVMGTRPWSGKDHVQENPDHPAVYISWEDVQAFVTKLNEAKGTEVYRVPTEAEWEYACRAGTTTQWSFGDDESQLGDYAWYDANAWGAWEQYAHEVGTKLPNPWELYDMHGNVWEWVQDRWGLYPGSSQVDPTGPGAGSGRVVRGGDFNPYAGRVRSAFRAGYSPDVRFYCLGARIACEAEDGSESDGATPLWVSTDHLDFGAEETERTFRIENRGDQVLTWTASEEATWLEARGTSGDTSGDGVFEGTGDATIQATVERTGQAEGTYRSSVHITSNGGDADITIVMTVGTPAGPVTPSGEDTTTFTLPGGALLDMVWIEPGTFMMGSPDTEPDREGDEEPYHEVTTTRGFHLGKVEITQEQWESVMGTHPWSGQDHVKDGPNYPAVYISWNNVQAFIAKLNEEEGTSVYRLPTEAEWEYACRAGTTTKWSFGDDESQLGQYAWYHDNAWDAGQQHAHEVGTKLPNPWGSYDMHGNVWEWCEDWYDADYYGVSPSIDPPGPASDSHRVLRSGDFAYHAQRVRSASRYYDWPSYRANYIGARLLRQDP